MVDLHYGIYIVSSDIDRMHPNDPLLLKEAYSPIPNNPCIPPLLYVI